MTAEKNTPGNIVLDNSPFTLLRNGWIVDGTGARRFKGDLLIKDDKIEQVSEAAIEKDCEAIDCSGKIISPGFIDMHSHMDWILPMPGRADLKAPFISQGCTSFVAGNCGYSPAGFKKNSQYQDLISLGGDVAFDITWDTMDGYFDHIAHTGMSHNLVNFVGHGMARASMRGFDPSALNPDEMRELLFLLEEALDQGACGVSFGLGYEPGIFATDDEIRQIAALVAKKDKIMSVHGRAYSLLSMAYEIVPDGEPHNVISLKEMIEVARDTGVRMQYSHLMFAGSNSHPTYTQCLDIIDGARRDGIDIMTDTYPYHCGNSIINVILPAWFLANIPANYHNSEALQKAEEEMLFISELLGFGFDDIQISHASHPELDRYNGMFLSEIAEQTGKRPFEVVMEFSEKTGGRAKVLNHNYSTMEIIDALIQYPACLFMTDTVVNSAGGVHNPATYGTFPLLLQYARDRKLVSCEEAVYKMTGASAERYNIKDRGMLKPGLAADVTVFDWETVQDNNTLSETNKAPTGIDMVFINGALVKRGDHLDQDLEHGRVVRI